MKYYVTIGEKTREVQVEERAGQTLVLVDGERVELNYAEADDHGQVIVLHGGKSYGLSIEGDGHETHVGLAGHHYGVEIEDERERAANLAAKAAAKGGGPVKTVMPGVVVELLVEPGQEVTEGQPLLVLEAMKMQNEIAAPGAATVKEIRVAPGQAVSAGDVLLVLTGKDA